MWTSMVRAGRLVLLLGVATSGAATVIAQELPDHVGKVNDFASVLDASQREVLEAQLGDLERATSAEVAVVTLATTGDRTVEDYAVRLFDAWGIGKKDRDNGVLILVAVQDRAMRIEVGYGLEGILPDGLAGSVIRESFLPPFRDGDYRTGLLAGTARVVEIVRRNETLTPEQRTALDRRAADEGKHWGAAALVGIFVGVGAFSFGTAAGAKVVVQLLFGAAVTGGALYLSPFVSPRLAVWLLHAWALGIATFGYILGRRPKWRRKIRGTTGGRGWVSEGRGGSWSSGGSGSGGSSSGGFGGGSSGGGGASGRW